MVTIEEIIKFLEDLSGYDDIQPHTDIFEDVGMAGDDFHEMIEKYAKKYTVDMSNYLWYFHTDEEGSNIIGGLFFKPPYSRVKRIPVTPKMLTDFANSRKWEISYPPHSIPTKHYDLLINKIVLIAFLVITLISTIKKCLK